MTGGEEDIEGGGVRKFVFFKTNRRWGGSKKIEPLARGAAKISSFEFQYFLNIYPAYQVKRSSLLDYLEKEYRIKISRMSPNRIVMFLINPPSGNVGIQKLISKTYIRML